MDGILHTDLWKSEIPVEKSKNHFSIIWTSSKVVLIFKMALVSTFFQMSIQGVPAFCDFTIHDPRYFVILFQAFLKKRNQKRKKKKNQLSLLTSFLETKSLFSSTSVVGWRLKRNIFFIKIIKIHYFLVEKKYESSILKAHFLD